MLPDFLGVSTKKANDDRRYEALDQILPHKEVLEGHLNEMVGILFKCGLFCFYYDVKSLYFEGETRRNELARSKRAGPSSQRSGTMLKRCRRVQ